MLFHFFLLYICNLTLSRIFLFIFSRVLNVVASSSAEILFVIAFRKSISVGKTLSLSFLPFSVTMSLYIFLPLESGIFSISPFLCIISIILAILALSFSIISASCLWQTISSFSRSNNNMTYWSGVSPNSFSVKVWVERPLIKVPVI